MKTMFHVLLVASMSLLPLRGIAQKGDIPGTLFEITGDRVNMRAKPATHVEVLGQADFGDRFQAVAFTNEWVAFQTPKTFDVWVSKEYVKEGVITAKRVNVRAGAGINYSVVGTVQRGERVTIRGDFNDWLKIEPTTNTQVWVSREFVKAVIAAPSTPAPENTTTAKAPPPPASKPAVPPKAKSVAVKPAEIKPDSTSPNESRMALRPTTPPPQTADAPKRPTPVVAPSIPDPDAGTVHEGHVSAPADLQLIPLAGQGKMVEMEGELRAAPLINDSPTRYRLVTQDGDRWKILCYVHGQNPQYREFTGKPILIRGREYWVQGAAAPVVVPTQIIRRF